MPCPSVTVKNYISAMYDWETDAAADLSFGILDAGCPADMDLTILESKVAGMEEGFPGVEEGYRGIVDMFLSRRHRCRSVSSFGSPPQHDPEIEEIVGEPLVIDDEAHVNTRENGLSGFPRERFYRLINERGDWRIDGITEKSAGELSELLD